MRNKQMITNDDLEEQRRFYKTKFKKLNWIPLPDEIIVQALRAYPAFWFISSQGYVLSLSGKNPRILKPGYCTCGVLHENGKRYNSDWKLRFKPFRPVYSEAQVASGKLITVRLSNIVAEHFPRQYIPEEYKDEPIENHHCIPKSFYAQDQGREANRTSNMRQIPATIHKKLTKLQNKTFEQKQQSIDEATEGKPQFYATQETLQQILKNLLADNPSPIVVKEIYADSNPQSKPEFIDIGDDIEFTTKDTNEQQEGSEEQ